MPLVFQPLPFKEQCMRYINNYRYLLSLLQLCLLVQAEEYKKPAFAFALKDGVWKGSGRSFGEFNLKDALNECEKLIIGGGGHAGACGVKVKEDGLEDFERGVNEYYKELKLFDQERYLIKKEDVATEELGEFKMELLEEIKRYVPQFGVYNGKLSGCRSGLPLCRGGVGAWI